MQASCSTRCSLQAARVSTCARSAPRAFSSCPPLRRRQCMRPLRARRDSDATQEELEAQLEEFMRRQAEIESGSAGRRVEPGTVVGADEVGEEAARAMCRDIVGMVKRLKELRDMSLNEVRLTVAIEDPRARERRLMGIEDTSGVSRDEMAAALQEVAEGRIPADRIALRELHKEMVSWPFIESDAPTGSSEAGGGPTLAAEDAAAAWRQRGEVRPPVGRDPSEPKQGLADNLPDFVGYGALYLVSAIPLFLVLATVWVLFQNSLR